MACNVSRGTRHHNRALSEGETSISIYIVVSHTDQLNTRTFGATEELASRFSRPKRLAMLLKTFIAGSRVGGWCVAVVCGLCEWGRSIILADRGRRETRKFDTYDRTLGAHATMGTITTEMKNST